MSLESGQVYESKIFTRLSAPGAKLHRSEFFNCSFGRCSVPNATLSNCRLINCAFSGCDLSGLKVVNTGLHGVAIKDSKAIGIEWPKAIDIEDKLAIALAFDTCNLSYSSFFGMKLESMEMLRCIALEVDFSETVLREGKFTGTDFLGSIFLHTDMEGADFVDAINYAIDPSANSVKGAKFSLPEAVSLLRGLGVVVE
jgi:uncharacterized protein YjbI with pentapeptide repeats